jgi:hypothetical protein
MAGSIVTSAPKTAKRNSKFKVTGGVSPAYAGVTVIVEKKVGNGSWKRIAKVKTDKRGKWAVNRAAGSSKLTVSYRAKTSDSRLGVLISTAKKTQVN